ncbi:MAG: ExbD/TolR family protein [Rhodospirillales bacterium]
MLLPLPRKREATIDISPLVDVVFQLLIFFVVTTSFLTDTGLPLDLPSAASGQQESAVQNLSVRVTADGAVRFRGEVLSLVDLEAKLRAAVEVSPQGAVTVYGDGRVDYETIVQVIDVARRVKARGIVLATEMPPEAPAP